MYKRLLYFIILGFSSLLTNAQQCTFNGRVINTKGEALPYVSIYFPEHGIGGMSNENGQFKMTVPCGNQELAFQSLGYESKKMNVRIQANHSQTITLKSVAYKLKAVDIDPNSEDPAYNIIRKATVMAELYKKQINAYQAKLYVRSYHEFKEIPWIIRKALEEDELAEEFAGDVQESIVEYSFKKPNEVKEKIIARKTARLDTLKQASNFINLDFYRLGGTQIINPLSRGAFSVYRFEYQHSYYDGDQEVHKIQIIPKRKGNDLMSGYLYINDELFNINQVEVYMNQQPLAEFDYFQKYQEVETGVWMPFNHKIAVKVDFMGVETDIQYLANIKEINVELDSSIHQKIKEQLALNSPHKYAADSIIKPKKAENLSKTEAKIQSLIQKEELSNRETFKLVRLLKKEAAKENEAEESFELAEKYQLEYADSAFQQNDSLWNDARSVPLSKNEQKVYQQNDSLQRIESGDTIINEDRSFLGNLFFFNGGFSSKNKKIQWKPRGLFSGLGVNYNTVDGWLISKKIGSVEWQNHPKGKFFTLEPSISYAVSRNQWMGELQFNSQYKLEKQAGFYGSIGRRSRDFNGENALRPWVNTVSTLLFTANYSKLFQEDFIQFGHRWEPFNAFKVNIEVNYAKRLPLNNNSTYKPFDFMARDFTPNLPINEVLVEERQLIGANTSLTSSISLSYTPKSYYRFNGNQKEQVKSKYPNYELKYRQGIDQFFNSQANFSFLSLSMNQSRSFRLIDEISYHFEGGKFLSKEALYFADFKNFQANPTYFIDRQSSSSFMLLDYYGYNSRDYYLEGHFSIKDNHLLLKYLPLLNETNWKESIHLNYLWTEREKHFYEFGYSLNQIFLMINAGVFTAFEDDEFKALGFRIGLNID